jgi:hypothetical protein
LYRLTLLIFVTSTLFLFSFWRRDGTSYRIQTYNLPHLILYFIHQINADFWGSFYFVLFACLSFTSTLFPFSFWRRDGASYRIQTYNLPHLPLFFIHQINADFLGSFYFVLFACLSFTSTLFPFSFWRRNGTSHRIQTFYLPNLLLFFIHQLNADSLNSQTLRCPPPWGELEGVGVGLLINILLIPAFFFHQFQVFFGFLHCFITLLLNDLQQSIFNIHTHWIFFTTYKK